MRKITIIIIFCAIASCADKYKKPETFYVTNETSAQLIPLETFNDNQTFQQIVTATYDNESHKLVGVVKLSKDEIQIVAMANFVTLFNIKYNAKGILTELSSFANFSNHFKPEYIISDIQLIYYPFNDIKDHFKGKLSVNMLPNKTDGSCYRIFTKNDVPIMKIDYIDYDKDNKRWNKIIFKNFERGYSYLIEDMQ